MNGRNGADNVATYHPDANTVIFSPNTDGYASYSEPDKGGILINALYGTMMNENKNNDKNLLEIEGIMGKKINNKNIDVLNKDKDGKEFITKHPVLLDAQCPGFLPQDRQKVYFTKNTVPKSERYFQDYFKRNEQDLADENIEFK